MVSARIAKKLAESKNLRPLLIIVGETASGKTSLAHLLAKRFSGEIISADSWTVYKEFNIGTAKPDKKERAEVIYHLLDVTSAAEGFNATRFKELAQYAIKDVTERGKLPILVGGTGLYIDSVLFDYSFLPSGANGEREKYNNLSATEVLKLVQNKGIDITGIDINNKRRLIRLLETGGRRPTSKPQLSNTLIIGLKVPKDLLETRIEKRVDLMLDAGLEKEVKQLAERYGWDNGPMKGIGYREWQDYFNGLKSLDETRTSIIKNTLKLAKKQRTWFKRNKSIQWLDDPSKAVDILTTFLNKT